MKTSIASVFLVTLCEVLKNSSSESWDSTSKTTKRHVDNSYLTYYGKTCGHSGVDVTHDLRDAIYKFTTDIYRIVSIRNKDHCAFAPFSLWLSLAAMAEGSVGLAQKELLRILNLPDDLCLRQKYYQLAMGRENSSDDVILYSRRVLAIDTSLALNPYWNDFVRHYSLLNPVLMPIRRDPGAAVNLMRQLISAQIPNVNLGGNSVLLESLDYQGLWTSAFSNAIVERTPFYNEFGQNIGTVDLMKIKKRVNVAYLAHLQLKLVELPVGFNRRYRMIFCRSHAGTRKLLETLKNTDIFEGLSSFRRSRVPIEVAVPRFTITTEFDVRDTLEEFGVKSLWSHPWVTRNVSSPPALPSSFIHRATVTLNPDGVEPYKQESSDTIDGVEVIHNGESGLDPNMGREFIADRPFLFALFDADLHIFLFGVIFSEPPHGYI